MTTRKVHYEDSDLERFPSPDEGAKRGDERSAFEVDRSRIIHSSAFRRLQAKTQVFSLGEGDFFRTRLTHSLEVAQIGKGLALRLGADPDLVEAVCLAHDLGHPPFGHAGGEALGRLMADSGGFEANAQNIRLLCRLEKRRAEYDGLNLTRATIDGIMKYKEPYEAGKSQERFFYSDDISPKVVEWACKDSYPSKGTRSFECEIMDWADEIAYSVHDFEDALHSGFVTDSAFFKKALAESVIATTVDKLKKLGYAVSQSGVEGAWNDIAALVRTAFSPGLQEEDPRVRRANRKHLTSRFIGELIRGVRRDEAKDAASDRYRYRLYVLPDARIKQLLLNRLVRLEVMDSARVQTLESKGAMMIEKLFSALVASPRQVFPDDWRRDVAACLSCSDPEKEIARLACDYISGMTDTFAEKLYCRLFIPGYGSVNDLY